MWRPKVDTRRDLADGSQSDRAPGDGPVLNPQPQSVTGTFASLRPDLERVDTGERHAEPATCDGLHRVPIDLVSGHRGTGCGCAVPVLIRQVRTVQFTATHPPAWHHAIEDAPEPFVVAPLDQVDHLVDHDILQA